MKGSTKFVWIVLAVIAALMIILTVWFRVMVSEHIVVTNDGDGFSFAGNSGPMITEEYDIDDFSDIRIVGGWDVLVIADDEFRVTVDYSEEARDEVEVEKRGGGLYLGMDMKNSGSLGDFHGASATIYMPDLDTVEVDGAVNLNVEDFKGGKLDFSLDGAGQITGENCSFEMLEIESNGAVNVDFYDSETVSADVNIDGAGNVMLNMNGGELSGSLSGLAHLEYTGTVSRMTVREDGIANVEYMKNGGSD
ncbi:MAG TPA: hypothetical protein DCO79_10230 [Spirochaeta sp.]|nr:hypothetical protein [Spirochaeta sp.]